MALLGIPQGPLGCIMTIDERLARMEERLTVLTTVLGVYSKSVSTVEGRLWGLVIGVAGALGTALLALCLR